MKRCLKIDNVYVWILKINNTHATIYASFENGYVSAPKIGVTTRNSKFHILSGDKPREKSMKNYDLG